jgi:hypothetical protein
VTASTPEEDAKTGVLAGIVISDADLESLSRDALVARLVAGGVSRLTAERCVEIHRGNAEPGRARPHTVARR